jgi:glycerophosphoryl diester phosphodiesterase
MVLHAAARNKWVWIAAVAALAGIWVSKFKPISHPGCDAYTPVAGKVLIAHAGGGLPGATYTNDIEAMDLAYRHGLRLIEIDLMGADEIVLAHDRGDRKVAPVADLLRWMRSHPEAVIVTDFKTDNVSGLRSLAAISGDLRDRFIPQIYHPSEYEPVRRLGFRKPVFTLYRLSTSYDWATFANKADLFAVTMPVSRAKDARLTSKPVFLHTVNEALKLDVTGFYTDCLIPG